MQGLHQVLCDVSLMDLKEILDVHIQNGGSIDTDLYNRNELVTVDPTVGVSPAKNVPIGDRNVGPLLETTLKYIFENFKFTPKQVFFTKEQIDDDQFILPEFVIQNEKSEYFLIDGSSHPVFVITKSLLLPFLCITSTRDEWYNDKDYRRLISSFRITASRINNYVDRSDTEQNFAKYWTDFYLWKLFKDDPTAPVFSGPKGEILNLFSGFTINLVRRQIVKKNGSFLYSLQKGSRKMWPKLGPERHTKALLGHLKEFTTNHGRVPKDLMRHIVSVARETFNPEANAEKAARKIFFEKEVIRQEQFLVMEDLRQTYEIFRWNTKCEPQPYKPWTFRPRKFNYLHFLEISNESNSISKKFPSSKNSAETDLTKVNPGSAAAVGFPRKDGGKIAHFVSTFEQKNGKREIDEYKELLERPKRTPEGDPIIYRDSLLKSLHQKYNEQRRRMIFEARETSISESRDSAYSRLARIRDEEEEDFYKQSPILTMPASAVYSVLALPEPSKFRILGSTSISQVHLQPVQGWMLNCIKNTNWSTMRHDFLLEKISTIIKNCKDNFKRKNWCMYSIDYSAATDKIKREAVLAAAGTLNKSSYYETIIGEIGPMVFKYPKTVRSEKLDKNNCCLATDGFPMGHALSFPFLCVINRAVLRTAVGRTYEMGLINDDEAKLIEENCLVNGDDMFAVGPPEFYSIFNECALDAGFVISAGKHYRSREFVVINSQLFRVRSDYEVVVYQNYINTQIITGISVKASGGESLATPTQVAPEANHMLETLPWSRCVLPLIFHRFIGKKWQGNFVPNWYLPLHLGGLGIDIKFAPKTMKITSAQLQMAARFISGMNSGKPMALYKSLPKFSVVKTNIISSFLDFRLCPSEKEQEIRDQGYPFLGDLKPLEEQDLKWNALVSRYNSMNTLDRHRKLKTSNEEVLRDGWFGLITEIINLSTTVLDLPTTDVVARAKFFKRDFRLHDISAAGLASYWKPLFYSSVVVPCPPNHTVNSFDPKKETTEFVMKFDEDGNYFSVYEWNPYHKTGILPVDVTVKRILLAQRMSASKDADIGTDADDNLYQFTTEEILQASTRILTPMNSRITQYYINYQNGLYLGSDEDYDEEIDVSQFPRLYQSLGINADTVFQYCLNQLRW